MLLLFLLFFHLCCQRFSLIFLILIFIQANKRCTNDLLLAQEHYKISQLFWHLYKHKNWNRNLFIFLTRSLTLSLYWLLFYFRHFDIQGRKKHKKLRKILRPLNAKVNQLVSQTVGKVRSTVSWNTYVHVSTNCCSWSARIEKNTFIKSGNEQHLKMLHFKSDTF